MTQVESDAGKPTQESASALEARSGQDAHSAPDARPIPPRFWWLKRLSVAGGVFVLLVIGVRLWWGWVAESRLAAKIAEYRAAGQPVLAGDFAREPISDEDNAALYLRQAAALVNEPPEQWLLMRDLRAADVDAESGRQYLLSNAYPLSLVRDARSKPGADWGQKFAAKLGTGMLLPDTSSQRALAKVTCAAALWHHRLGNDREAIESVRDSLSIGRNVVEIAPTLIPYYVRGAIDGLAVAALEGITADLRLQCDSGPDGEDERAATREQVYALVSELLNEQELGESCGRAFVGERADDLALAALRARIPGFPSTSSGLSVGRRLAGFLAEPLWQLDAIRCMKLADSWARAALAADWPSASRMMPVPPGAVSKLQIVSRPRSTWMMSHEGLVRVNFRALAARRMAAMALAIRLYEVDHQRRPNQLDELVPIYLPQVLTDPFAAHCATLQYRPDISLPVLYSIGYDGRDDGGSYALTSVGFVDPNLLDMPYFLDGERPCPAPRPAPASASQGGPASGSH